MEAFRVGTERLPVYTMSWSRSVQNYSFPCSHERAVPNDSLSPFIRNKKHSVKSFPTTHMLFETLPKIFFKSKFFGYRQLSSVDFPLASFLSVPDENGSGCSHENFFSIPYETYFLGGPVLVPLVVLSGTVPSVHE